MEVTNPKKLEKLLNIFQNQDGTFTRPSEIYPTVPPSLTDISSPSLSKDVTLNSEKSTWVRIFIPRETLNKTLAQKNNNSNKNNSVYSNQTESGEDEMYETLPPSSLSSDNEEIVSNRPSAEDLLQKKLPIIVYVHGSGFVVASAAHPNFHDFCSYAASELAALVVSVEYRLAPEHRLPAAYDDVLEALSWVRDGKDEWVREYGDVSNCVLMGDSAGGNIVYYSGLTSADQVDEYKPLNIIGLVLVQPFFSGLDRTGSELRLVNDSVLTLESNDLCWDLALPIGSTRGHEFSDPIQGGGSSSLDKVRDLGIRVWVVACDGDPLYDRTVELVKLLEKRGVSVRSMFLEGGQHGMFVGHPSKFKSKELLGFISDIFS